MPVTNSPNMSLPVPVVGQESGPQYATDVNNCFSILDTHDHSAGKGVPITPSGLNINSDLPISSNNLIQIRSSRYTPQVSPLALATDLGCTYVSGVDLYFNDVNGNQVRITQSGAVAGTPGSIANLVSPASASYVSSNQTFVWQSNANTPANMDAASYILRNLSLNSFGLTLNPPTAMGSDSSITLPTLPASTSFLTIDSSGNMGASIPISLGITDTMLAANSVTTDKIVDLNVTEPKLADNSVATRAIIDGDVTPEKLSTYVSNKNAGSAVVNSTGYTSVTSTSITVSGVRPVLVTISHFNNSGAAGSISVFDTINPPAGIMSIDRGGSDLCIASLASTIVGAVHTIPASMTFLDQPVAGAHTYTLKGKVVSTSTNFTFTDVEITAVEL